MSTASNRLRKLRMLPDKRVESELRATYAYTLEGMDGIYTELRRPLHVVALHTSSFYWDVISTGTELALLVHEYNRRVR